jgi:hypothetical protein
MQLSTGRKEANRKWPVDVSQEAGSNPVFGSRDSLVLQSSMGNRKSAITPPQNSLKLNFLPLTWNVTDNKGPLFPIMGLTWNVYENKWV